MKLHEPGIGVSDGQVHRSERAVTVRGDWSAWFAGMSKGAEGPETPLAREFTDYRDSGGEGDLPTWMLIGPAQKRVRGWPGKYVSAEEFRGSMPVTFPLRLPGMSEAAKAYFDRHNGPLTVDIPAEEMDTDEVALLAEGETKSVLYRRLPGGDYERVVGPYEFRKGPVPGSAGASLTEQIMQGITARSERMTFPLPEPSMTDELRKILDQQRNAVSALRVDECVPVPPPEGFARCRACGHRAGRAHGDCYFTGYVTSWHA